MNLPPLTEERRRELVKVAHNRVEEARVATRNIRRDSIKDLHESKEEKLISEDDCERGEKELQKITDHQIELINAVGLRKENESLEV